MRGQLSAEMLILLVLVLALSMLAFTYMSGMVGSLGAGVTAGAQAAMVENNPFYCKTDSDCTRFTNLRECVNNTCSP